MIRRIFVVWLFLFYAAPGFIHAGYTDKAVNRWENFTDLKNVISIAVDNSSNTAFCATSGGMYVVDLNNGAILRTYTNIDGLIDISLTMLHVDTLNRVWIGASDGSISILDYSRNTWHYIYDIKNSSENNKTVTSFAQFGEYMFVGTGYGIHKIGVVNFNFIDAPYYQLGTLVTKSRVNTLAIAGDKIFAGTALGVAYARIKNTNLNNPASWSVYTAPPMNSNVRDIEYFDGKVFIGSEAGFVYFDNINWYPYPNPAVANVQIKAIKSMSNKLYFIAGDKIYYAPKEDLSALTQYYNNGTYNTIFADNAGSPLVGEAEAGILVNRSGQFSNIFPNCPYRNVFDFLAIDEAGVLWAAGGQGDAGFYRYDGVQWDVFTTNNYPEIGTSNFFRKVYSGFNMLWALSFGGGPTKISNGLIKNYNPQNSNLPGIVTAPNFCVPFGGGFDNNGIFWASFYENNSGAGLYAFTGDSIWQQFNNPGVVLAARFEHLVVDGYNTKWIVSGQDPGGLYFFNENGTLTNPADDIFGFYYTNDFSVEDVTFVVVDKNNEIWIATNNGIYIISNPLAAIQDPNQKPAPQRLGIISGNLKVPFTENCRTISVDILNHKWIGTENNGVFHLSDDGSTLIEQFNKTNSPILSNQINSIAVNNITGKAYIGTNNGISVLQTDAVQPVAEFDKIICSPNPYVLPSPVNLKIDGLVEGSSVKIISLTGEIMAEFTTPGGRIATWNGLDKKGRYLPSGVYIVVAFNKDGSKVGKGKLAVVRK